MNKYLIPLFTLAFIAVAGCEDKSKPPLPKPTVSMSQGICSLLTNELASRDNVAQIISCSDEIEDLKTHTNVSITI